MGFPEVHEFAFISGTAIAKVNYCCISRLKNTFAKEKCANPLAMRDTATAILCLYFLPPRHGTVQGTGHLTGFQKSLRCSMLVTKFLRGWHSSGNWPFHLLTMADPNPNPATIVELLKSNLCFENNLRYSRMVTKFLPERLSDHLALLLTAQPLHPQFSQDLPVCGFPGVIRYLSLSIRCTPPPGR
jgi:hypothetical protein